MNQILRISGYIFHPLLMPLVGVLCYYAITPRFIEPERMLANIYAIATLTTFTPIVLFFYSKILRLFLAYISLRYENANTH